MLHPFCGVNCNPRQVSCFCFPNLNSCFITRFLRPYFKANHRIIYVIMLVRQCHSYCALSSFCLTQRRIVCHFPSAPLRHPHSPTQQQTARLLVR
jgi:hypothetical protein